MKFLLLCVFLCITVFSCSGNPTPGNQEKNPADTENKTVVKEPSSITTVTETTNDDDGDDDEGDLYQETVVYNPGEGSLPPGDIVVPGRTNELMYLYINHTINIPCVSVFNATNVLPWTTSTFWGTTGDDGISHDISYWESENVTLVENPMFRRVSGGQVETFSTMSVTFTKEGSFLLQCYAVANFSDTILARNISLVAHPLCTTTAVAHCNPDNCSITFPWEKKLSKSEMADIDSSSPSGDCFAMFPSYKQDENTNAITVTFILFVLDDRVPCNVLLSIYNSSLDAKLQKPLCAQAISVQYIKGLLLGNTEQYVTVIDYTETGDIAHVEKVRKTELDGDEDDEAPVPIRKRRSSINDGGKTAVIYNGGKVRNRRSIKHNRQGKPIKGNP